VDFKDKFIAFVDILGFKDLVARAERGEGMPLAKILELLPKLGRAGAREFFERHGPQICPVAPHIRRDLDFLATQVSDCVIMSAEVSPAGGINLVNQSWLAVTEMLTKGLLCRGYITRGKIYHTRDRFVGSGYHQALAGESAVTAFRNGSNERGTPFVEIDASVRDYLLSTKEGRVAEMFGRLVEHDGTVTAIYPFKQLCAKFALTPDFDPAKQQAFNQNLRIWIHQMKGGVASYVDKSNESAVRKVEHYLAALNRQLEVCDQTDKVIDALTKPFPGRG
jgi:hypothetical protein